MGQPLSALAHGDLLGIARGFDNPGDIFQLRVDTAFGLVPVPAMGRAHVPLILLLAFAVSTFAAIIPVRESDVLASLRSVLPADFDGYVAAVNQETPERVRQGEFEHLVYYILQSQSFTRALPIEPAVSAREYFEGKQLIPTAVVQRIASFRAALRTTSRDVRLEYFERFLKAADRTDAALRSAYVQAMRFLYAKEVESSTDAYERRAHSSDTQLASSYTVASALEVLHGIDAKRHVKRVLIVGPGADFAARTGYSDAREPRSYQPWAVAATLLRLDLASPSQMRIECVDINERVLDSVRSGPPKVLPAEPGDREFLEWQRALPAALARAKPAVSAERLNVITERFADRQFDLIIATNVLLYFPPPQLLLALANINSMLAPGGIFIHNETRLEVERYTKEMGLNWVQARRILIGQGAKAPLYDVFAILRK